MNARWNFPLSLEEKDRMGGIFIYQMPSPCPSPDGRGNAFLMGVARCNIVICLLLFIFTSLPRPCAAAGTAYGREFYIACPPNQIGWAQQFIGNSKVIIVGKPGTSGTIGVTDINWLANFVIPAVGDTEIMLSYSAELQDTNDEEIVNHAIHIITSDSVTVFLLSFRQESADMTLCLPVSTLDTLYVIAAYCNFSYADLDRDILNIPASQFVIVAIEDSTNIYIYPTASGWKDG